VRAMTSPLKMIAELNKMSGVEKWYVRESLLKLLLGIDRYPPLVVDDGAYDLIDVSMIERNSQGSPDS